MPITGSHLTAGTLSSSNGTTASVSPGANKLILVTVTIFSSGTVNAPASVLGNGITYTLIGNTDAFTSGFGQKRVYMYRGMSASPSPGTIVITGGSGTEEVSWVVDEVDTANTGGTNGSAAVVQWQQATGSNVTSLTITLSAFASANNGAYGAIGTYDDRAHTPGTGWAELYEGGGFGDYNAQTQWRADNDTSCDWTFTADFVGGIAIEIAVGASATVEVGAFRFRENDGDEDGASWPVALNTNLARPVDTAFRLRIQLDFTGDPSSKTPRWDYRKKGNSTWLQVLTSAPAAPDAIVFAAASEGQAGVTPAVPSHQAGDILLCFIASAGGEAASLGTANGFAAVDGSPQATGATTTGTRASVYWVRATSSSMPAPVITDPGNHVYAIIGRVRGCIAEGSPFSGTAVGNVKASASTSVSATGMNTAHANCRVFTVVARDNDSAAAAFSSPTGSNLSGLNEDHDAGTAQGNGGGLGIFSGTLAAAGATGTLGLTVTSSINAFLTFALRPQSTPILFNPSSFITSGGENTTAQLTAPSGKSGSDFQAGRIHDDENGVEAFDPTADFWSEFEASFISSAAGGALPGEDYEFRLSNAGTDFDIVSQTPVLTISAPITAQALNLTQLSVAAGGGASAAVTTQALALTQISADASGGASGDGTGNAGSIGLALTQLAVAASSSAVAALTAIALTLGQQTVAAVPQYQADLTPISLSLTQLSVATVGNASAAVTTQALALIQQAAVGEIDRITGLVTPSNGSPRVGFRFVDGNMPPWEPMTYIWRYNPRQQAGYYTNFFHGSQFPEGLFDGNGCYYGCHLYPYESGDQGTGDIGEIHHWEIAMHGTDTPKLPQFEGEDDNGNSTEGQKGRWYIQAVTADIVPSGDDAGGLRIKYWYDLPDTNKVVTFIMPAANVLEPDGFVNPALAFLSNSWAPTQESNSGIWRALQLYISVLDIEDILVEAANHKINSPQTSAGQASVWHINQNPTPDDISDKSGEGHDPEWVNSNRPTLYEEAAPGPIGLSLVQISAAAAGGASAAVTTQALALTQQTATADGTTGGGGDAEANAGPIALTLTQLSAAAAGDGQAAVTVQPLALVQLGPNLTGGAVSGLGSISLSLTQLDVVGSGGAADDPGAQALTLTQMDAAASGTAVASLTPISLMLGQQQAEGQGSETAATTPQAMALTQLSLTASGSAAAALTSQALSLTQQTADGQPAVSAAAGAQTLTLVQVSVVASGGALAGVTTQSLTLTQLDVEASAEDAGTGVAGAQALTLVQLAAAASGAATAEATTQALVLSQQAATGQPAADASTGTQALALTQLSAAASGSASAALTPIGLSLVQQQVDGVGTAAGSAAPAAQALALSQLGVSASGSATAAVTTQALALTQQAAEASGSETATGQPAAIALSMVQLQVVGRGDALAVLTIQVLALTQQDSSAESVHSGIATAIALSVVQNSLGASGDAVASLGVIAMLLGQQTSLPSGTGTRPLRFVIPNQFITLAEAPNQFLTGVLVEDGFE